MDKGQRHLFQWNRTPPNRIYSRTQKVTSNTDVQKWIKTVESNPRLMAAKEQLHDAQIHEAAYSEAEDLLNHWAADSTVRHHDILPTEAKWIGKTSEEIAESWCRVLDEEMPSESDSSEDESVSRQGAISSQSDSRAASGKQSYAGLINYDDDDDDMDHVINKLLSKTYTKNSSTTVNKKNHPSDPRLRMELRHKQVKENRERMMKEKKKQLQHEQQQKEMEFLARQQLKKEELARAFRARLEEEDIQQHMVLARKELQADMQKKQQRYKQKQIAADNNKEESSNSDNDEFMFEGYAYPLDEEKYKRKMKKALMRPSKTNFRPAINISSEEAVKKTAAKLKKKPYIQGSTEEKTTDTISERERKLQAVENMVMRADYRLKQQYFLTWSKEIEQRRKDYAKASAFADWRLMCRTFNSWKRTVQDQKLEDHTLYFTQNLREAQRKMRKAEFHYNMTLLRRTMTAWQLYLDLELNDREIERNQERTRQKMKAFLEAAASGKMFPGRDEDRLHKSFSDNDVPACKRLNKDDILSMESSTTDVQSYSKDDKKLMVKSAGVTRPNLPWQVNKKHLGLTPGQLAQPSTSKQLHQPSNAQQQPSQLQPIPATQSQDEIADGKLHDDENMIKPWLRAPFIPLAYEHRHAAQQRILEQQQQQIREQQNLIKELQYLQRQQILQQQLLAQRQGDNSKLEESLANLHTHIKRLQESLLPLETPPLGSPRLVKEGIQPAPQTQATGDARHAFARRATEETGPTSIRRGTAEVHSAASTRQPSSPRVARCASPKLPVKKRVCSPPTSPRSPNSGSPYSDRSGEGSPGSKTSNCKTHPKHLAFLKSMEERAAERARLKQERENRKRQIEEEKRKQILAEEASKRKEEEELRRARIREFFEKKRLEKERDAERQRQAERIKELTQIAKAHHRLAQMKYCGWLPWRKLIFTKKENEAKADKFYHDRLLKQFFHTWHDNVAEQVKMKVDKANQAFTKTLVKRVFLNWTKLLRATHSMEVAATNHYASVLLSKVFKEWAYVTADEKLIQEHREHIATERYHWRLISRCFNGLRRYPEFCKLEDQKEKRRQAMRQRVVTILPDFQVPPSTSKVSRSLNHRPTRSPTHRTSLSPRTHGPSTSHIQPHTPSPGRPHHQ